MPPGRVLPNGADPPRQSGIRPLLVWYAGEYAQPRTMEDHQVPNAWVVDGQQRTTALVLLLGRKPYWWEICHRMDRMDLTRGTKVR
jgi:hypothetical protein